MRHAAILFAAALLFTPSATTADEPVFEVVVLGTVHAPWQFRDADFTPGHIRAALELAKPEVIGVESNPEWFAKGRFHDVTYEAQGIALPFAKSGKIPVYGVDWMETESFEKRSRKRRRDRVKTLTWARKGGPLGLGLFGRQMQSRRLLEAKFYFGTRASFNDVNGVESREWGESFVHDDPSHPNFGGRRNREIAARCAAVMKAHPGKRLVVVIGGGHKAVLDILFSRMEGVRVLHWGEDVPAPTKEQAAKAMTTDDLLCVLGHNLDGERSYFHAELADLDRMEKVIGLLPEGPARRYFRARISHMRGERHAAAKAYDRLIREDADARIYPFPLHHWRMRYSLPQAARIEKARVLLEVGASDPATLLLNGVLRELPAATFEKTALRPIPLPPLSKGMAKSPLAGWYLDGSSRCRAGPRKDGTLEVSIEKACPPGTSNSLSISARLPEASGAGRRLRFSVEAKAEHGRVPLTLAIGIPSGDGWALSPVGSSRYPLIHEWVRHEVEIDLPGPPESGGFERATLFAFFRGPPGTKVWFLEPRLERGEAKAPPTEDEIAAYLTRQFVLTLLDE